VVVRSLVPETEARTACFKAQKYFISERNVYRRDLTGPNYGTGVFNSIFSITVQEHISHSYQTHEKVPAFYEHILTCVGKFTTDNLEDLSTYGRIIVT